MNIAAGKMKRFNKQEYDDLMRPLFEKAIREGLWFYTHYQDIWFSPGELKAQNENGKYLWGPVSWRLRDPQERINELEIQKGEIDLLIHDLKQRISNT